MKNQDYIGKTSELKHHKITIPLPWNPKSGWTLTYYIAKLPNGETFIHEAINREKDSKIKSDGYGGSILEFLIEDGTVEKVLGPYYQYYPHTREFEYIEQFATETQKERLKQFLD